jgi:hypothetical protein
LFGQLRRNSDERNGTREIVLCVGSLGKKGHSLAYLEVLDVTAHRVDGAPAFMAW